MTSTTASQNMPSEGFSYERVREHLTNQYDEIPYHEGSGLPPELLKKKIAQYMAVHPDQPHVLQKAKVLRMVLAESRIWLDPHDPFPDKVEHSVTLHDLRNTWFAEAASGPLKEAIHWFDASSRLGVVRGGLDTGHIAPGWCKLLQYGLTGLLAEAQRHRDQLGSRATPQQRHFYDAVAVACQGVMTLAQRFSDLARELAIHRPQYQSQLQRLAEVCARVPAYPAQTFHEALQTIWFLHEVIQLEGEAVRSLGHFDRMLTPYYRADIESGRLTREEAKELLKCLWVKNFARTRGRSISGKNMVLGGQDADGNDATSEFTFVCLEAYEELGLPDPKFSVRLHPGSPLALQERLADMIRRNQGSFVLMNDVPIVEALTKRGKTLRDARTYLSIGCYEPAVDGKETPCTSNLFINMVKVLELALHQGVDPVSGESFGVATEDPRTFSEFEQLFDAYTTQLDGILETSAEHVCRHEEAWPSINPSPLLACSVEDCLALGKDIGQGGAHYNTTGCIGVGLANVADSLLALKQAVFDEERVTMAELLEALAQNYTGAEGLRQYLLNKVPKYGNAHDAADAMAKRVADHYCAKVHSFRNARGGSYQAALYSFALQWQYGKQVGALPDGRKAFMPLAPGAGPMVGRDREGITAMLNSVGKLDFTETPDGAVLDIKLHPSAVKGPEGLQAFITVVQTFFAKGGFAMQFNVVDADTLRDAQVRPEEHASLQVRVTGYSAYFTKLSRDEQDQIIAQTAHGL